MRVVVNALSATNLSGRHVLLGHLSRLAHWTRDSHHYYVLFHAHNRGLCRDLGDHVEWIECPPSTAHWAARSVWERIHLPSVLRRLQAQALLSPAGMATPGVSIPQVVMALNPWCIMSELHHGVRDRLKACLQRLAYRRAQRRAAVMLYASNYMDRIYRDNAGCGPRRSRIAYIGIDDAIFEAATEPLDFQQRRCEILTVSVMARHKAVEVVAEALRLLRRRGVEASLTLAGPWPDASYRREFERLIRAQNLTRQITFTGHVPRKTLYKHYARARVFCLLSRCESFGIPAVEAQAFGTPCVVADCCAPPEIAGPGGICIPAGDAEGAADALQLLLTDAAAWRGISGRARANAERFRWDSCSRSVVEVLQPNYLLAGVR